MLSSVNTTRSEPELTPAGFHVLVALASGEAHGYAVMQFVERLTDGGVQLPAGTLYRTLARLVADGLVEESGQADPSAPHDARRRYYRLTHAGRRRAGREADLMSRLVSAADDAGLLVERRPG